MKKAGSFDVPSRDRSRGAYRPMFLESIRSQAPGIMVDGERALSGRPLTEFNRLAADHPDVAATLRGFPGGIVCYRADEPFWKSGSESRHALPGFLVPFDDALREWAHRWHLVHQGRVADWCSEAALRLLRRWYRNGRADRKPWEPLPSQVLSSHQFPVKRDEAVSPFSFWGYDGLSMSRQQAWDEWVKVAKLAWDAHCDCVDRLVVARGGVPLKAPISNRPFERLVRVQCLGEWPRDVADDSTRARELDHEVEKPSLQAIMKDIRWAADAVGLTLRHLPRDQRPRDGRTWKT